MQFMDTMYEKRPIQRRFVQRKTRELTDAILYVTSSTKCRHCSTELWKTVLASLIIKSYVFFAQRKTLIVLPYLTAKQVTLAVGNMVTC